jgi:hypothetical protein
MILVCGEALIDLFAQFDDASGPTLRVTMGGSPLNVATGLVRLDAPAAGWSADHWGGRCSAIGSGGVCGLRRPSVYGVARNGREILSAWGRPRQCRNGGS